MFGITGIMTGFKALYNMAGNKLKNLVSLQKDKKETSTNLDEEEKEVVDLNIPELDQVIVREKSTEKTKKQGTHKKASDNMIK